MNKPSIFWRAAGALIVLVSRLTAAEFVWWEGEDAREHGFTNRAFPPAHCRETAAGLSGGD
ncbi:MAG: hypothetical protein ACKV19_12945 [Verrucomicrobiales bacterium]